MRCSICNTLLLDNERTKKYADNHPLAGQYLDTCNKCMLEVLEIEPSINSKLEDVDCE